jgi:superfamily II DNA or RNA helicase
MMSLRSYRLDEAHDQVVRLARFRAPQRAAFDALHGIIRELDGDLPHLGRDRMLEQLRQHGFHVPNGVPYFVFHLATGVGKTRLMGAILSYLYRSGQSRNALILAPRTAIVDRLERISQVGAAQYLFLDPGLVPEPNLCFRGNVDSFDPRGDAFNVFVLSPQSISGGDRRFARPREFRGPSLQEYLRRADDLVVFTDEAHHLGADDEAAWTAAIHGLGPRLHFGLTATPKTGPGVNVLYSYDLTTCLREGLYTKGVNILVDPRDDGMSDEEWDRYTVDYALRRLERKREAILLYTARHDDFEFVEPVALICARDIDHAEAIASWLTERRGLTRDELLVTHSQRAQTEAEIARLVTIDQPGNRIRVVVNVYQLTEGWDVTNVYVIAPLRAMATFQGAVQTMGRGLRLPAGRRVDDPDIDKLDILCYGRESLEGIIRSATETFGVESEAGPAVDIATKDEKERDEQAIPRKEILIRCLRPWVVEVPNVRRVPAEPALDFDVTNVGELGGGSATAIDLASLESIGINERVAYDFGDVVRISASRIIARLRYLSDFKHGVAIESLVDRFLTSLGASREEPLFVDPIKLSLHLGDEIDRRYRMRGSRFDRAGEPMRIEIGDVGWTVPEELEGPLSRMPVADWTR